MLASHADRERTVDVLKAGFSEGRLRHDELEDRSARAYTARTVGELALLVADLPQGPLPLPLAQPAAVIPVPQPPLPVLYSHTNGKAVSALICGLCAIVTFGVTGVPALVLGHTGPASRYAAPASAATDWRSWRVPGVDGPGGWAVLFVLTLILLMV